MSHFSRAVGIRIFRLKREDIGNMFPICISNDLLNICSEPFVMVFNVRAIFCLGHFVGIREDIENMFPICISNDLLNMCFEPFVMVFNVRSIFVLVNLSV